MKSLFTLLKSLKLTILLLVLFALSIAIATFIENDYGTETAWAVVYKTRWFEIIQILLAINLLINIFTFKMYKLKKLSILMFHLAFIVILIGSALTRYVGYEGMMNIKEGYTEHRMLSSESFFQIEATKNSQTIKDEHSLYLSKFGNNDFNYSLDIDGNNLDIQYKNLIKNAKKVLVETKDSNAAISFKVSTIYGIEEYILKTNSAIDTGIYKIYFNTQSINKKERYINIYVKEGAFYFTSNTDLSWLKMKTQEQGIYTKNTEYPFSLKQLYSYGNFQFVPTQALLSGKIDVIEDNSPSNQMALSALVVDVTYKGETKEAILMGKGKQFKGYTENIQFKDTSVNLEWGSKIISLPFSLHLEDFIIDKYAGSNSPSSYESKVVLIDKRTNTEEKRRIYMNNTLTHDGFTFYQSSYDADEKGTILSVNKDPGKWPTYLGYFLLIFGLVLNLLNPHSRFMKLAKTKYEYSTKISSLLALFVVSLFLNQPLFAYSDNVKQQAYVQKNSKEYINSLSQAQKIDFIKKIDKEHSNLFATILIQTNNGRIKPIDSLAIDTVNKIAGTNSMFDLTYNQVFTGMVTQPLYWQRIDLFKVKHPTIKKILGINPEQKRFSYIDVFNTNGEYKFMESINASMRTKPGNRGTFEKELIKIDEKLNVAYNVFEGEFFKVFPSVNPLDKTLYTAKFVIEKFPEEEKNILIPILRQNAIGLGEGYDKNDWVQANKAIGKIKDYQNKYASDILSSTQQIDAEILYNRMGLFQKLFPVYLIAGLILLVFIFVKLIKPTLQFKTITRIIFVIFSIAFILHTMNLGLRWYVSGHAPWSNSYEAMLYISWTIILSGIIFSKQSNFALATTGVFSGIVLFVANLSWLDPQITNLVPVLKSYWLTIHVSVITASYGFLGLSAMLGFITLILFIILGQSKNETTKEEIVTNIRESVKINELSMTIGLTLLIAGNFLGGIWANESWGRYWGWDPKETWTLVTILLYAIVIHLRYIPKANTVYIFSALSLLAYSSVIMTYFGVNYYLSGLHSYAAGDPLPIPSWIYYTTTIIFLLIIFAFKSKNKILEYKTSTKRREDENE